MAQVLGRLLGDVWGPAGFWFMTASLCVALWVTTLSNQDGFMRLLSEGTRLIASAYGKSHILPQEHVLRRSLLIGLLTAVPAVLFVWGREPVALLALAGSIEALQLPIVAALVLFSNRTRLPATLRPGPLAMAGTMLAALFFALFAILLLGQMANRGE